MKIGKTAKGLLLDAIAETITSVVSDGDISVEVGKKLLELAESIINLEETLNIALIISLCLTMLDMDEFENVRKIINENPVLREQAMNNTLINIMESKASTS